MQYPSQLLTKVSSRRLCAFSLLLSALLSGLPGSASVIAKLQATRPRIVPGKPQPAAARKHAAKSLPLTAADHREAEQLLADFGYWPGPPKSIDGRWDVASRNALIAFQKVERLRPTGQLTRADFGALLAANRPSPREIGPAHIEVDLFRQVLFIVDGTGQIVRILPVSTGSGKPFTSKGETRDAITPPGRYRAQLKIPGWKKSDLGRLYYPVYFMYGTAIHGYPSVPTRPASHGCVRIPMFAAKEFYEMIPVGMPVIVYRETLPPSAPTSAHDAAR